MVQDAGVQDAGAQDAATPDASQPDAGFGDEMCIPSFGASDACGGDPVGSWVYRSACTDLDLFAQVTAACPGASFSNTAYAASGTLVLNGDNTFTRNVNTTVTTDFVLPVTCVIANCSTLAAAIDGQLGGTTTCTPNAASGCDCSTSIPLTTNDSGTYTVNGSIATVTPTAGMPGDYYFCEDANVLKYRGTASNVSDSDFSYVLTRM